MTLKNLHEPLSPAGKTLKSRSLLAFLTRLIVLCVLPLVLLAIYLAINHVQTLQSQSDGEADDQVRNVATAIDRQLGSQIAALQVLAASPLVDDPPRLNEFYNEARAFRESFGGHVILAELSMQMLFNTREPFGAPLPKLPRPKGHAAAPEVLETGKPAVGDMFLGPIAKEPLVAVAVPVLRNGQTRSLLLSVIETRQFQQRLDDVSLPAGWSLTVLDGKEEVMARRRSAGMEGGPSGEESPRRFVAKSAVSHWSVVLEVPGNIFRAPIISAAAALLIAILAATLVSIVGGRLASLRLARSVASLTETPSPESPSHGVAEIEAVRQRLVEAGAARDAAETSQRESERRYQDLWEKAPVMMISLDKQGRITVASDRFCEELGYDRDEILGKTPFEFQTKDAARYAQSVVFPAFLKTGLVKDAPLQFVRKNGEVIDVLLNVTAERDSQRNIVRSRSVFIDVTERNRAEEALRNSEANYSDLYENAPDMYASVDPATGRILKCNETLSRITGYTKEEIVGRPVLDMYHPDSQENAKQAFQLFKTTGEVHNVELKLQRKDLGTIDVILNATAVYDEAGRILYSRSSLRDITDRKKAEEALKAREEKYRLIVESMQEVVYQTDMEGRVIFASPSVESLLGFTPQEVLGTRLSERYVFPEERTRFLKLLIDSGSVTDYEAQLTRKDGSRLWVSTNARLIKGQTGNPVGVEGVTRDISARKEAEEFLRESEERFRLAFENANIGVCLVDPQGRLLKVNDQICEMFGYSRPELEGMTVNDIAHPEDTELSPRFMERASSGEVDRAEFEKRYIHKQGHVVWGRVTSSLVRDRNGNPLYFVSHVQNLTERKRAEKAAKDSEERYRHLVEVSPDAIAVHQEGRLAFVNPAGAKMVGAESPESLIGRPVQDIVHPDCWEEARKRIQRMLEGETGLYPVEDRYLKLDGTSFPVEVIASPFTYRDKPAVQVVARDITERKKSEEALRESEARYRYLVENIEDFICTHDLDGNLLFVSSGAAHLLGVTPTDMVGRNIRSYLVPEAADQFDAFLAALRKDGRASGLMLVQSTSGEKRLWEYRSKLHGEAGAVPIVLGIARDVTERKRSEQALRESESRYRELFSQSMDGIYVMTLDGMLFDANQAFLDILGYKREDIVGRDIRIAYVNPSDQDRFIRAIETRGSVKDFPLTFKRKDGKEIECLITSSVRRAGNGAVTGYQGILRDVTEQKNLEKQFLQAQKMEAVGTLAGGVAHDFNNILQIVLGYSELLLSEEQLPKKFREDLAKMNLAARNGADLVQRLLTFSRKTEFKPLHLNLNGRIEQLQKMLSRTISKMIEMEPVLTDNLWSINADPTQVDQVLMNLAVNARDAMPEGGKLIIETANVTLDEDYSRSHLGSEPGSYVLLSVSDTGHGMDKETLQHIFEPFFTTKGLGEGTGLGLATVYGIVKHHEGYITCYSEPGSGTTFKLYFPAVISDDHSIETAPRTFPRGGSETLLLVEDEEFIRDLGSRILLKAGYKVVTASNGKEALEVYRSRADEIALVILDLIMPEMAGKQCLEELLQLNPAIKIVIASGYSANGPTKEALSAGAKGFVNKPYDIRQMLEVVRSVLDQKYEIS